MFLVTIIILLTVYLIWRFGTRNFGYWKRKGVRHEKPMFFFGNMYEQTMLRISISELIGDYYMRYTEEKYIGLHIANDLALILRDPELIKRVLVTDFKYFHQRGLHSHKHYKEPLFHNLFTADGDIWKLAHQQLTSAFSSAKVKAMFPLIKRTTEKMLSTAEAGNQDVRELMARYTTDFIGACGFGLDFDSLNDESSMFRRVGKRIFEFSARDVIVHISKRIAPELFKHVNYFSTFIEENILNIVKQILEQRKYMPSGRNDFVDFLLELKQKGKIVGESLEHFNSDGTGKTVELELDDMLITAQVFVFFAAGFETSSSATSFLLHELAFHPEVQEQCHKEIDKVLSEHGDNISYEAIKEMKYLKMAFMETLRLHPSPGFLIRKCARKYTFPETALTIDEDVYIFIPLQALHTDPRFFEDPEDFKPDRFIADKVDSVPKYGFMPFGAGPRSCIGERLGIIQSLAGVSSLLSQFSVEPAPTSRRQPLIDPRSYIVQNVMGGLPLKLVRRKPAY